MSQGLEAQESRPGSVTAPGVGLESLADWRGPLVPLPHFMSPEPGWASVQNSGAPAAGMCRGITCSKVRFYLSRPAPGSRGCTSNQLQVTLAPLAQGPHLKP